MLIRYYFIFFFILSGLRSFSQDSLNVPGTVDSGCIEKDVPQLIRQWFGKPEKPPKSNSLFIVPTIGSNPAMGFMIGIGGQYAFKLADPISLYSLINAGITYTTKNQLLVQLKNNIYTKSNKFFLSGDWRFLKFSQSTYGLSTKAPIEGLTRHVFDLYGYGAGSDTVSQPMRYNYIRFYQTVSLQLKKSIYAGFGFHYDNHYSIVDEKLDTVSSPAHYTSHYLYSKQYGFSTDHYSLVGVSLNFVADTRDNMVNSYKGYFANVNYKFYPDFFGNTKTGNTLSVEWRSFHGLSKRNPRHLIGFWLLGDFSPHGQLPYLDLPSLGYDQRGRGGRGYVQGRYRGPNSVYAETEYRFPISPCSGILGGVLFINATTADSPDGRVKLFEYIAPAYGAGLRIKVDKNSRTNLQVDFGFGKHSSGFYLGAAETF